MFNISLTNAGANTYLAAGSLTASQDIQSGTGAFAGATTATITFGHAFGAAPTVMVIATGAQSNTFSYFAITAATTTTATVAAFDDAGAAVTNTGNFAYIAIGNAV